jgi:tetratricopeptide (TPR) repeat protein
MKMLERKPTALYTLIVTRVFKAVAYVGLCLPLRAQEASKKDTPNTALKTLEQEPPEEDPDLKPTEYSFNPLEATRNITTGDFYYKKGNVVAAAKRYLEATKWDPTNSEAFLKLGEAYEKNRDTEKAREAYTKFISLGPDPKKAEAVSKRLAKLPMPKSAKAK